MADSIFFGISLFGDGATIKTVPVVNAVYAGVHNPFALLDLFGFSNHFAKGGNKYALYIANMFLPLFKNLVRYIRCARKCLVYDSVI